MAKIPKGPLVVLQDKERAFHDEIMEERGAIASQLRSLIPAKLETWRDMQGVTTWVANTGSTYAVHYALNNFKRFGFDDARDCVKKMKLLKKAWCGIIDVQIVNHENCEVQVFFWPM
jgi:hypothetical protein